MPRFGTCEAVDDTSEDSTKGDSPVLEGEQRQQLPVPCVERFVVRQPICIAPGSDRRCLPARRVARREALGCFDAGESLRTCDASNHTCIHSEDVGGFSSGAHVRGASITSTGRRSPEPMRWAGVPPSMSGSGRRSEFDGLIWPRGDGLQHEAEFVFDAGLLKEALTVTDCSASASACSAPCFVLKPTRERCARGGIRTRTPREWKGGLRALTWCYAVRLVRRVSSDLGSESGQSAEIVPVPGRSGESCAPFVHPSSASPSLGFPDLTGPPRPRGRDSLVTYRSLAVTIEFNVSGIMQCATWVDMSVIHPPVCSVGDDGAGGAIGGSHEAHHVPEADAS